MAIARIQTAKDGRGIAGATHLDPVFGSNVTSGNLIVVAIRAASDTIASVVDTLSTSYTLAIKNESQDPRLWIYSGVASSTGACTVTVTFAGVGPIYCWAFAAEYAPGSGNTWSSPYDTGDDKTGTGVTDLVTDAISTAQNEELVFAIASQGALIDYTAGADFTLIDGAIGSGAEHFGGAEQRITSSALSSYVTHMTSGSSAVYTMLVAAFKDSAGGGPTTWGPLLGLQNNRLVQS